MLVQGQLDELVPRVVAQTFADAIGDAAPDRAVVLLAAWKEHIDLARLFLDKDPLHTTLVIDWLRTLRPMGWPVERSGAERVRQRRLGMNSLMSFSLRGICHGALQPPRRRTRDR